jgi:uncharacterized MAPEG superfamily protein
MFLHAALITALAVVVLFIAMGLVGRARGKYKVQVPATTGHPDFERAFRAHQNTVEQTVMFLPVLWLATIYGGSEHVASVLGFAWVIARLWYVLGYIQEAKKRSMGFLIGFLAFVGLLGMSLWGIIRHMVH